MKVVATQTGFYDGSLREPGTEFEVPDSLQIHWAVPVGSPGSDSAKPKPVAKPRPRALSELSRPGKSFIEQHGDGLDDIA